MKLLESNTRQLADQTAKRFATQGYEVRLQVQGEAGGHYDLVAFREGHKIAFEFVTQSQLAQEATDVLRMRRLAIEEGYQDFRLVVVPELRFPQLDFEGLNEELFKWLQSHPLTLSRDLGQVVPSVQRVELATAEKINVTSGQPGMRVSGTAVVEFLLAPAPDIIWDSPLSFTVSLDQNWQIQEATQMQLDISSLRDDILEAIK